MWWKYFSSYWIFGRKGQSSTLHGPVEFTWTLLTHYFISLYTAFAGAVRCCAETDLTQQRNGVALSAPCDSQQYIATAAMPHSYFFIIFRKQFIGVAQIVHDSRNFAISSHQPLLKCASKTNPRQKISPF